MEKLNPMMRLKSPKVAPSTMPKSTSHSLSGGCLLRRARPTFNDNHIAMNENRNNKIGNSIRSHQRQREQQLRSQVVSACENYGQPYLKQLEPGLAQCG